VFGRNRRIKKHVTGDRFWSGGREVSIAGTEFILTDSPWLPFGLANERNCDKSGGKEQSKVGVITSDSFLPAGVGRGCLPLLGTTALFL
jgi:hypothetical protein